MTRASLFSTTTTTTTTTTPGAQWQGVGGQNVSGEDALERLRREKELLKMRIARDLTTPATTMRK